MIVEMMAGVIEGIENDIDSLYKSRDPNDVIVYCDSIISAAQAIRRMAKIEQRKLAIEEGGER